MSFFKHVGMANAKKVIIIQRQIPGEEHMAAVIYSDILPSRYHDDVMKVLESPEGQAAWEFKDILQRRMASNGDNLLQALSGENFIKRVAQSNILVKPNSKSSVRLDELVKLLSEAGRGESAVRKLEEMDRQQGLTDDASQTNGARNQAKVAAELNEGPSMYYEPTVNNQITDSVTQSSTPDMNQLMMQMMQTMQQMQKEIAEMKEKPAKKTATKKTAV